MREAGPGSSTGRGARNLPPAGRTRLPSPPGCTGVRKEKRRGSHTAREAPTQFSRKKTRPPLVKAENQLSGSGRICVGGGEPGRHAPWGSQPAPEPARSAPTGAGGASGARRRRDYTDDYPLLCSFTLVGLRKPFTAARHLLSSLSETKKRSQKVKRPTQDQRVGISRPMAGGGVGAGLDAFLSICAPGIIY